MRFFSVVKFIGALSAVSALVGCQQLAPEDSRDLLSMERVRQFLVALSIYQDRVPSGIASFDSPREVAKSVYDTLYGAFYTNFWYSFEENPYSSGAHAIAKVNKFTPADTQVNIVMVSPKTIYVYIPQFVSYVNIAGDLRRIPLDPLNEFAVRNDMSLIENIIVDMRDNGGGEIAVCTSIVELFVPSGKEYIRTVYRDKDPATNSYRTFDVIWKGLHTNPYEGKKVAVLIDHYSASASEILAAALKDALLPSKVTLIGLRSYGKGIGQGIYQFPSTGDIIAVTSFHFYRICNNDTLRDYHHIGIPPDVITQNKSQSVAAINAFFGSTISEAEMPWPNSNGGLNKKIAPDFFRVVSPEDSLIFRP